MQAAAQAAESDRLLAKSVAERAELRARYMALGAKLGMPLCAATLRPRVGSSRRDLLHTDAAHM